MKTYMGSFSSGQAPVALFAGFVADPRGMAGPVATGRGFGAVGGMLNAAASANQTAQAAVAASPSGFDYTNPQAYINALGGVASALGSIFGTKADAAPPAAGGTVSSGPPVVVTQPATPAWLLPVAVAGGALVFGALVLSAMRRK